MAYERDQHLPYEWYMSIEDCCAKYAVDIHRKPCQIDYGNDCLTFRGHYGDMELAVDTYTLVGCREVQIVARVWATGVLFFQALWHSDTMTIDNVVGPLVAEALHGRRPS